MKILIKFLVFVFVSLLYLISAHFISSYFILVLDIVAILKTSFFKVVPFTPFFDKFFSLIFSIKNVRFVLELLSIITLVYFQTRLPLISFPIVVTRSQVLKIMFAIILFLINQNLFWVIEYVTMLSRHTWQIVTLENSMEGILNFIFYYTIVLQATIFILLTIFSNLFVVFYIVVKFYYACLTEAELLVKRLLIILPRSKSLLLLLILPKRKNLDKLIRIILFCFNFILLISLSVVVLLTFSHTTDLLVVYLDLQRIVKNILSEEMFRILLMYLAMFFMFLVIVENEIHDLDGLFEFFFHYYIRSFLLLAVLLPVYPPVL